MDGDLVTEYPIGRKKPGMTNEAQKIPERDPQITYRIASDGGGKVIFLNLYVDGAYAGGCTGYREDGNRNRIHIYPKRVLFPYSRMKLKIKRAVWYWELPPEPQRKI